MINNTQDCKKYKKRLWYTRVLTPNATCTTHAGLLNTLEGILLGERHYESTQLSDKACKGMIEAMMVWIMIMKDREEMHGSREEVLQEERKQKEKKRKRKQKKEQKRKEKNAELRRRTEAKAIAKPNTKITSKTPNTTSRNAHTTKSNTTTTTSNTSRTC